jgi:hypothetical protein
VPERVLPTEIDRGVIRLESLAGPAVEVPRCTIELPAWVGPVTVDTYGGKVIVDAGTETYAELAVLQQVVAAGWDGVWVDSFGRGSFRRDLAGRAEPVDLPAAERARYDRVRAARGVRGGCWDIWAWSPSGSWFLELKRRGRDRLSEGQHAWLLAAMTQGHGVDEFLVVEWTLTRRS